MELIKRAYQYGNVEHELEGHKLTLYKNFHHLDGYHLMFEGQYPELSNLFLELTGFQIQELGLKVDECCDRTKGKPYSQLVIDLNKVNEIYQKYNLCSIVEDRIPKFVQLAIDIVRNYTGVEEDKWLKDSYFWATSINRKELHFYESEISIRYDGFDWRCLDNIYLTEGEINDIAFKLGLTKESWVSWVASI